MSGQERCIQWQGRHKGNHSKNMTGCRITSKQEGEFVQCITTDAGKMSGVVQ